MTENIKFTLTEQKIYDEILNGVKSKEKKTVSQIAEKLDVAPSYIIKVAKKLGYSGLNDMWYSLSSIYTDKLSLSLDNFELMDHEQLEIYIRALCELLNNYRKGRIMVNSIGDSDYIGAYFLNKLWERGFNAVPFKDHLLDLKDSSKSGMLFAINESGIVLLEQCLKARKKDWNIVSITGNENSPLACNSHLTIELKNDKSNFYDYSPNFFAAYVLIFIEMLFAHYDEEQDKK